MKDGREIIQVQIDGKEFEFYAHPTIVETQRIKQEVNYLLGDIDTAAKLDAAIQQAYQAHADHCKKVFGEEEFKNKLNRLEEIEKELGDNKIQSEEFIKLFDEIHNNPYYLRFSNLTKEKFLTNDYAYMQVCCVSPKGYDFFSKSEKALKKLVEEVREKKRALSKG